MAQLHRLAALCAALALTGSCISFEEESAEPDQVSAGSAAGTIVMSDPVGTLPGALSVAPDGDAIYHVQLEVPPGRAGVEPALSLAYSSRGGDGLAGVGWSLQGLSSI